MKKVLLIVAILAIVACVVLLALALFNYSAFRTLMDGAAETYRRLYRQAVTDFIFAGVSAAVAAVCFVLRVKL